MFKKLILFFCIFLSLTAFSSTALAEDYYSNYYCETLKGLGVETQNSDDEYLTKGEFAKIIAELMKIDTDSVRNDIYFRDVSKNHEYFSEINALAEYGYILGDDVGRVYPDEPLTLDTAKIILVRCLGYEVNSKALGGWMSGYNVIAADLEIDQGIGAVSSKGLSYSQINRMIFNTLAAPTCEYDFNEKSTLKGDSLAQKLYSAKEITGQVKKTRFTGIDEVSGCLEGNIIIEKITVETGEIDADSYLGKTVRAMVIEDDDEYTLVSITEHKKNSQMLLTYEQIEDVPDLYTILYYDEEKNKTKRVSLDRNVSVIYNYQKLQTYDISDLKIDNGYIELVDGNSDDVYDVALVYEYKTYFVAGVDAGSDEIYDKYGYLPLDASEKTIILNHAGYEVDVSVIANKSVLSAYIPKVTNADSYTVIMMSGYEPIVGKVSAVRTEGTDTKAVIDGVEYTVDKRYIAVSNAVGSTFKKITHGLEGTFYLNKYMQISGFDKDSAQELYGYMKKIYFDEDDEDKAYFELFSEESQFVSGEISEKLRINGTKITNMKDIKTNGILWQSNKVVPQLVRFTLDKNGRLSQLKITDTTTAVSPMLTNEDDLTYNGTHTGLGDTTQFRPIGFRYGYKYLYDSNTVIFNVPSNEDIADRKKYSISTKNFVDGERVSLMLYDICYDYIIGAAVNVGGNNAVNYNDQQELTVIKEIKEVYDDNESVIVTELIGVLAGSEIKYTCPSDETYFDGFKKGDIVRIVRDTVTGDIIGAQKVFTFDDAGASADTDAVIYHNRYARKNTHLANPIPGGDNDYGGQLKVYGRCIATGDNTIALTLDGGKSAYANSVIEDAGIYVVEYSDRGINVTKTSFDNVIASSSPAAINGHSVLLSIRNALTREIFIIKKN